MTSNCLPVVDKAGRQESLLGTGSWWNRVVHQCTPTSGPLLRYNCIGCVPKALSRRDAQRREAVEKQIHSVYGHLSLVCFGSQGDGCPHPISHGEELHLIQGDAEARSRTRAGSARLCTTALHTSHDEPSPCPSNAPRGSGAELTSFPPPYPCGRASTQE